MKNPVTYEDAKRHVERKIGFFIHVVVYVLVNGGLILLNRFEGSGLPWSLAPLLGWGIGLLFHGLAVYLRAPGVNWKERMIRTEMSKHKGPPSE